MWRKFVDCYRQLTNVDEQLAVLERPELATRAEGNRGFIYRKLAKRSPVERQQLRDFSLAMRGWRSRFWTYALLVLFTLCGVALHLQIPDLGWTAAIVAANACGIGVTFALISAWFNYRQMSRKKVRLMLAVVGFSLFGALAFTGLSLLMEGQPLARTMESASHFLGGVVVGALALMTPVLIISILRNRQYEALNAQLQREAEQARLARELSESELRLLRAQIEPHFLFNTLGAVQQLAQHGAPRAAELTANLIDFLRSSMRDMRSEHVQLAVEFALIESYLKVMQVRLGERLRFSLQLPRALEQIQLPSMILLTLVENAVKHGIEPALRGGEITVSAEADGGALRIRVRDSGIGISTLAESASGGTGLDNVRHRLRLVYGDTAGLVLRDGDPGLVAEITIPHSQA